MLQFAALLNPYLILAFVAYSLLLSGAVWYKTHEAMQAQCVVEKGEMAAEAQKQRQAELGQAIVAATKQEALDAARKVQFKEIGKRVTTVVGQPHYRDTCLDADGLHTANTALTRPTPATP